MNAGFRFKDRKLYIFTEAGEVMLIESWPELRAVRKPPGEKSWRPFEPAIRLVQPYRRRAAASKPAPPPAQMELGLALPPASQVDLAAQRKRALDAFRFSLPKEVARSVERLPARQWRLLQLFREREQALELAAQNAALTFCLAYAGFFRTPHETWTPELAASLSQQRQREIAGWLGFPSTEAAARILGRVEPEAVHPQSMLRLRGALEDGGVARTLAQVARINAGVLGLVIDAELRRTAAPKLLGEVAESPGEKYRAATAGLLADLLVMKRSLPQRRVPESFSSLARLREVHRELSEEFCQLPRNDARAIRFPSPPLPSTPDIVPLRTPADLAEEGRQQSNCVASYVPRVAAGEVYVYRVLRPERATLSLVPDPDGTWEIDQLYFAGNHRVADATHTFVQAWVDRYSL
jgi:hypothetical protein